MSAAKLKTTNAKPLRRMVCIDVSAHPWVPELLNAASKAEGKRKTTLVINALKQCYKQHAGARLQARMP